MPLTNKLIFSNNSGNVGIGTTNPASKLDVIGVITGGDGTIKTVVSYTGTGGVTGTTSNHPYIFYANNDERARIDASGNLGIGTTSPSNTSGYKTINVVGTNGGLFRLNNSDSTIQCYGGSDTAGGFIGSSTNHPFVFYTNSLERARITSGGEFQIGPSGGNGTGTISASPAGTGFTNHPGSDLVLQSGNATGTGSSIIKFLTPNAGSSGTSTNTATERARITSGGYFKAASLNASYINSSGNYHEFNVNVADDTVRIRNESTSTPYGIDINFSGAAPDNNTQYFLQARDNASGGTNRCIIYSDGDLANHDGVYGTISDQKLKQDIVDAGSQWDDIKAIRFRKYRMKSDVAVNPDAPALLGVIAQELEQVSPGLVDEHPDMETVEVTDEDGNVTQTQQPTGTTTKTVKSSILLMKAAVALQEAMARIEKLEAEVAALKGA